MTRKERVIAAIQFESVDRIPYSFYLNGDAYQRLVDFTGDAGILNRVHNHITSADFSKPHRVVKPDFTQDEYGVIWNKSGVDKEIGVVDNIQIQTMEDLEKYQFPEVDEAYIRSQMQWLQDFPEDTFKLASLGFCLFERAWTLMGMENLLCCMLTEPELVHTLRDRICARNLAILDIALS